MKASARRLLFSSVALLALAGLVQAQETRGRITGRVTDPSRAAVPNATVKVADVARGTVVSSTTSTEGLFQANYLLSGTYQVTVEAAGFKKQVTSDIVLQINETRDLSIKLEVGAMEETVSVSTDAVALNTSDANMGFTVDQNRLASLPLIHGDPYKIMGLATGMAYTGSARLDRPYEPTHIVGYAMDGTRGNRSDLLIDGVPSTATANANEVISTYVPPSDLVQEFKVQTATFDAQFGNTEGGVTSIGIKSGTNRLHGSLYYFAEPWKLGANDFFGKARGQDRVESSSDRPGITLNGPIIKDRTFFTVGWEHIKDVRPRFDIGASVWVPTEAMRNGDFSAYSSNILIYDPLTRVQTSPGQYSAQPFPGNVIPADRISPVARGILQYYSLPKSAGLVGNIYDSTLPETAQYNTTTFRVDQKISDKNRMFVRGSWYNRESNYNDYVGTGLTTTWFQFQSYQGVIDDVHMFNATTVLNVRYGYNRFERNSGPIDEFSSNFDLTKIGFSAAVNDLIPAENRGFPRLDFTGGMVSNSSGNDFRPITSHTVASTLNKTMGAHSAKIGMEMRIYREDSRSTGNARAGQYTFNNTYTRQNSASGTDWNGVQAYAAFLLGMPGSMSITRASDYSEYSKTWGFFIHDDWRVSPKLTLNIGLRYEVETPLTERQDKSVSGFDYEYVQPIQGTVQERYAALNDPTLKQYVPQLNVKGGLLFAGKDTSSGLYTTPKDSFLPRFGFAYQMDRKTVVRGGAGLFAGFLGQRRGDVVQPGYSQTTTVGTTTNAFGAPISRNMATGLLETAILEPVGNALGRQTSLGNAITFFNPDPKVSKQLRWQVGIERELVGGLIVSGAYVGNYGYDIEIGRNINALPNQYLSTENSRTAAMDANNAWLTAQVTNPFAGLVAGSGINNATVARQQLLLPYPGFGAINTTNNEGKTWYHSAQLGLQKRFSKGNTIGISYTYSHWMQATEYLNAGDPTPTKMISDQDVPHRLAISAIYQFPFGKGRRFMSNATGIANAIIGGWQVQGVFTHQSGFPTVFGTDAFYNGNAIAVDSPTTLKWFNTDVFTSVLTTTSTLASPVNHLRTMPLRFDDVRNDAIDNCDLSLIKDVEITKDVRLQLRAEFVNAFNHPLFPGPIVNPTQSTFGIVTASNVNNYARRAQVAVKLIF
jgi:hypothetical protein